MGVELNLERGILVIAHGNERFLAMANNLAVSLRLTCPGLPLALVTDRLYHDADKLFDIIIDLNPAFGFGFSQKLHMDLYSPFRKTIFLDADCLVIESILPWFEKFSGRPVSVIGNKITEGNFIGTTIEFLKTKLNFEFLPTFNGGLYYFEKGEKASCVFDCARNLFIDRYDELKLITFSGKPGDEPVMSLAMGIYGLEPVPDELARGMFTPVGQHTFFRINAPTGYCEFMKYEKHVKPVIMHFGGGYPEAFHYRREVMKIQIMYYSKIPAGLAAFWVNIFRNPGYAVRVFIYRLLKRIIKGTPFRWKPVLPMFIFE